MSHITREFEDWEEYDKAPAKKFEWGDEKTETETPQTELDYYKQRLQELWFFWVKQAQIARDKGTDSRIVSHFEGKAEGYSLAYLLLDGFDLNEDKR